MNEDSLQIFWAMMPWNSPDGYQGFGEICCSHQITIKIDASSRFGTLDPGYQTKLHRFQRAIISAFTTVRTSNLKKKK
jgi:hypothetical protein